ncbi:hypothetical protein GCM10027443_18170 [Pontibacter brevis]
MFIIDRNKNRVSKIQEMNFVELGLKERENLQEWVANDPAFFGEELLIIQKEFDGFNDTRERLDLLAIDKVGDIVVIENKLDDSGRDVTWQVLKYASYCATLSKAQIRSIYQQYLDKCGVSEDAESNLSEFLEASDFEEIELNKSQRIIMVSGNFRKEVTSTVLWLLSNKLRIQCFKVTPYSLHEQLLLNVEQVIPVKEAEDYIIRMAEKKQEDSDAQEELKSRHKIRLEFWKELLERANQSETRLFQNVNPSKDSWISAGVGMSGVGLNFVISRNYARSELYISRSAADVNKFIFDQLFEQKQQIECEFGGDLVWERLDDKKACRIKHELTEVSLYEREDWDKMMKFMIDGMIRMEKVLVKRLQAINYKLKKEGID